jgi:hypothetical protein
MQSSCLAVRPGRHDSAMFLARIVCSDSECTEELEVSVESLDELDGYVCECGFGFVLLEVGEHREPGSVQVLALPERRRSPERRAA